MRLYQRLGFVRTGRRSVIPARRDHITEQELALEVMPRARRDRTMAMRTTG